MRLLAFFLALVVAVGFFVSFGCGTAVTIYEEEYIVEPAPSDTGSAGLLSGFAYSTGGEHYKTVQSLGSPVAEPVQESENGAYSVK